ncbi:energy transducer TonB [Flavobacterium algicola]|uniref:energy transducer TonB n=1 Tax=Flavobacterium algicola TaxID=556529 RepID=UPI001EFD24AC|nr:energy transducer TonB [Flavobacterium algicola]MCG9793044.1 energy transducer TonB [Flavobacterium algicola]
MSKSSIYESDWINLVFENKNKEYGAYQLRQESTKTTITALLVSLSFCALLIAVPKVLHSLNLISNPVIEETTPTLDRIITPVNLPPAVEQLVPELKAIAPEVKQQVVTEKIDIKNLAHPTIVPAAAAIDQVPINDMIVAPTIDPNAIVGSKPTLYSGPSSTTGTSSSISATGDNDNGNAIATTTTLDKQPVFPGGIEKLYSYVGRNFETSDINEEKIVRIMVYFVVEKDGSMTDIQVKNNPGHEFAQEAIRVLKSLRTKWSPGQIDSKPVRTAYTLPISVQTN